LAGNWPALYGQTELRAFFKRQFPTKQQGNRVACCSQMQGIIIAEQQGRHRLDDTIFPDINLPYRNDR